MSADDAPPASLSVETVAAAAAVVATASVRKGTLVLMAALGEEHWQVKRLLRRVLQTCGRAFVAEVLSETARLEANGGLLRPDGGRRTRGGVFFYLTRTRLDPQTRARLFHPSSLKADASVASPSK